MMVHCTWRAGLVALLVTSLVTAAAAHSPKTTPGEAAPVVLAPGWTPLTFDPPAPGTYELPPLGKAIDAPVLTSDGEATTLHALYGRGLALLSFVYTTCPDVNGCPLATAVLAKLHRRLADDAVLRNQVTLLSLSVDPIRDTPTVMREYGAGLVVEPRTQHDRAGRNALGTPSGYALRTIATDVPSAAPANAPVMWRFLTTASETALAPILAGYDQAISKDYDADGTFLGTISHVLRVVLIDRARRIRNIYSVSFLHADTVLTDLRTLLAEGDAPGPARAPAPHDDTPEHAHGTDVARAAALPGSLQGAGDDKAGYEHDTYQTRSRDLARRRGTPTDLLALARTPPRGLPAVPVPGDNPLTAAKIALGRKLFFDRRLSLNDTVSCAMCHVPEQGFASNELQTAVGIEGRTVRRNAPTIYNVGYLPRLFHDGREHSLEQQIWGPLLAQNEMGNPSVGHVVETLQSLADYGGRFEAAFAGRGPDMLTIGAAIASYERTLVSADAPFDRWRFANESDALTPAARRGFALFTGKGQCAMCHTIGKATALFTDGELHDTGIGYRASMTPEPATRQVQVAPGVTLDVDTASFAAAAEPPPSDLGRYEITQDPADRWQYRTPTLRNVALTAPYMHDGSLATLREVVEFYDAGGVPHELLDPRIHPLGLDASAIDDLVAFLTSLTGANVDTLVADAFAAPVGDADAATSVSPPSP